MEKICAICKKTFETNRKDQTTCSKKCRKEFKKQYLKEKNYCYDKVKNWRKKVKEKAVEYKGGKCSICGYNRCLRSMEFHHLDPTKKDFAISKSKSANFDMIKSELDKCILVCSNCHGEIHDGLTTKD